MEEALSLITNREWFEAHEAIEDLWRPAEGDLRRHLQGLIHLLVSLEHLRRQNPHGCLGQWKKACRRLQDVPNPFAGLEIRDWMAELEKFYGYLDLESAARNRSFSVPVPKIETWPIPALAADNSAME